MSASPLLLVHDGGAVVGTLEQSAGRTTLRYEDTWRRSPDAIALSLSLLLSKREHGSTGSARSTADAPDAVDAFLWGLLPDNELVLERWGRQFHVSSRNDGRVPEVAAIWQAALDAHYDKHPSVSSAGGPPSAFRPRACTSTSRSPRLESPSHLGLMRCSPTSSRRRTTPPSNRGLGRSPREASASSPRPRRRVSSAPSLLANRASTNLHPLVALRRMVAEGSHTTVH